MASEKNVSWQDIREWLLWMLTDQERHLPE